MYEGPMSTSYARPHTSYPTVNLCGRQTLLLYNVCPVINEERAHNAEGGGAL